MQPVLALDKASLGPGHNHHPPALTHLCCNCPAGFRLLALLFRKEPLMSCIPVFETRFINSDEVRVDLGLIAGARGQ